MQRCHAHTQGHTVSSLELQSHKMHISFDVLVWMGAYTIILDILAEFASTLHLLRFCIDISNEQKPPPLLP